MVHGATGIAISGRITSSTTVIAKKNGEDGEDGGNGEVPETCDGPGFNDTPQLPDSKWRISDACRPLPPQIDPGETAMKGTPPSDAKIPLD